jgi:chromosomal replication initiation ATPase DnaA
LPSQLILPLISTPSLARGDFIVAPGNEQAVALIDSWPNWPVGTAVIYGPSGSGKTHLVSIWQTMARARVISAAELDSEPAGARGAFVVEDVDSCPASEARDVRLFRLIEGVSPSTPLLLTGKEAPATWPTVLPDLASRFSAALSFSLWKPDDELLAALAKKLLADRQLAVPAPAIARMLQSLERTPQAVRDFIARADAKALSEGRPITLSLVRELIADEDGGLS